jgi:hypothetical protein
MKAMQEMMETQVGSLASMMDAKLDAYHERRLSRMDSQLSEIKAEIRANNETSEVLRDTLVYRIDAHPPEQKLTRRS